jgi:hypothetical protein
MSNSICNGLIKQGLPAGDCANLPAKGYERLAILINREDVDFTNVTLSETHQNVVTALGLKAGKSGYEVHQMGSTPFTGTNAALESNDYYKSVTKNFVVAVINNDRDVYGQFVDPLLNGEFIAVVERKDKGRDKASAFEIIGYHNGLTLTALDENAYGDYYGGGLYTLTETAAPVSRMYLGETYEAGKAIFDSLLEIAD